MKHSAKLYYRMGYICIFLLICFLLPFVFPKIGKLQTYSVISESMEPNIPVGSLLYVKEVSPDELQENDVITFYGKKGSVVTHRIVSFSEDGIVTKGDANQEVDLAKVQETQILGKVVLSIPFLGYLIQSTAFYLWLFLLLVFTGGFWWKAHSIEKKISIQQVKEK